MSYDEKYRKRAIEYREEGHTIEETSKIFKIGTTTLKTWIKKYRETGEIKNKVVVRTFKKIDPVKLEKYLDTNPDAYLSEMAKYFSCSNAGISKALKKLKITRKKRLNATKNKTRQK